MVGHEIFINVLIRQTLFIMAVLSRILVILYIVCIFTWIHTIYITNFFTLPNLFKTRSPCYTYTLSFMYAYHTHYIFISCTHISHLFSFNRSRFYITLFVLFVLRLTFTHNSIKFNICIFNIFTLFHNRSCTDGSHTFHFL